MLETIKNFVTDYRTTLIKGVVILLLIAGAYTIGHVKGDSSCQVTNANKGVTVIEKGVQTREQINKDVISQPDAELDKRLSRWMRD